MEKAAAAPLLGQLLQLAVAEGAGVLEQGRLVGTVQLAQTTLVHGRPRSGIGGGFVRDETEELNGQLMARTGRVNLDFKRRLVGVQSAQV